MKIAIVGSREFPDRQMVEDFVRRLNPNHTIISGGARGVDSWAEHVARTRGMEFELYEAEWDKFGKSAGFKRNVEMVKAADMVVAFWDGESKGTRHTMSLTMRAEKPLDIHVRRKKLSENEKLDLMCD